LLSALVLAALLGIDLDSESARLHLETGLAYIQQGLLEQAVEELQTTLELDPGLHEAYLALGRLRARMGDPESAVENLQTFMELRPGDYRGPLALARLRMDTGSGAEARDLALQAHALNPAEPEIWMVLGSTAALCGDTASAMTWLNRIVEEGGPMENAARVRAAALMRAGGRMGEARALLLPAASDRHPAAIWGLARVYTAWEDYMRASDALRSYLRLEPEGRWADSARMELERFSEEGLYIPGNMP
jgi:tetratricopeptide (TPR) repeat protein